MQFCFLLFHSHSSLFCLSFVIYYIIKSHQKHHTVRSSYSIAIQKLRGVKSSMADRLSTGTHGSASETLQCAQQLCSYKKRLRAAWKEAHQAGCCCSLRCIYLVLHVVCSVAPAVVTSGLLGAQYQHQHAVRAGQCRQGAHFHLCCLNQWRLSFAVQHGRCRSTWVLVMPLYIFLRSAYSCDTDS